MASFRQSDRSHFLFQLFFLSILFMAHRVKSADENDNLLQGINKYRISLNLTALTKNDNAACLAEQIAEQFKDQPCSNTTGSNTVPGTEDQFPNYMDLLSHCHLNVTNTRDGAIMPACVPNLVPSIVLSNFTESQYSSDLNDSKYTGAGIGADRDWIVVVLSTNTSSGDFETYYSMASFIPKPGLICHIFFFLVGCFFFLL